MANMPKLRYQNVPETTADLEWADLVAIDLSRFDEPGGKQELAAKLKSAISETGFFYVSVFPAPSLTASTHHASIWVGHEFWLERRGSG